MRLVLAIQTQTGDRAAMPLSTAIHLPRGCGIDNAREQITRAVEEMKKIAEELFMADTEGREPRLTLEESAPQ